jgi:hypothetical protein
LAINEDSDEFEEIPENFRHHLDTLVEKERKELLEKLSLYLKEKPSKEAEERFEFARKRIAEIENNALKNYVAKVQVMKAKTLFTPNPSYKRDWLKPEPYFKS